MYKIIREGKASIKAPKEEKVSKELPVFYNPVMELNRTVSVLLLNAIDNKKMQIADPLGGTGVRAIRLLKELPKSKVKKVWINDINKEAVKIIKENLKMNKVKASVSNEEANLFLLKSLGFDYIDIDPFGSPNMFLDAAIKRLGREGILAVTATDTGCLAGTFPDACLRKYWAVPQRNDTMHENGLRILIRKVQLIGAEHDKALVPIYSYSKEHYFRVFFKCEKGKHKADEVIKQHGMLNSAGPLWLGRIWDEKIAREIAEQGKDKFLKIIAEEAKVNAAGFYDLAKTAKRYRIAMLPNQESLLERIRKKGYKAEATHFADNSIRTDIPEKELVKLLR